MFTPLGKPRKLPFPLYNQVTNANETSSEGMEDNPFIWPEDSSERTLVPLFISLDEWVAVTSAIDVGADIAYPLQYIEVIYILMRNMRYSPMICSLVIDCITNDADTKQALIDALTSSDEFNQYLTENIYRITEGQIVGKLVGGDCDNSVVAGRAIALVERLDINNKDALEAIVAGTNDEALASIIISGIPGLGEAPIDEIVHVAVSFIENFAENYNSISNEERKDRMANDIYCIMLESEDCSITFQQLFDYYQAKATSGLNIVSTLIDVVQFLLDGDFDSDDQIWFGMFALQIGFILNSRDFFGIGAPKLGAIMRDAGTSTAWEEWDDCVPPDEPNVDLINNSPSVYLSTLTFLGHPSGHPERDIWEVSNVPAIGNPAYIGYDVRDSTNACINIVSYTKEADDVLAAGFHCGGGYFTPGTSWPDNTTAEDISGNTSIPSDSHPSTNGAIFTFILELV